MLGIGLAALPQKLLAEVVGFAVETAIVVAVTWHWVAGYEETKFAAERAAQAQAVAEAQTRARGAETQLTAARQEIVDAQNSAKLQIAATGAAFVADAVGLRKQLADALGGRGRPDDSLESCQQRAATAGNLLADGLRVQAKLAGAAESHAADLRAVRQFDAAASAAQAAVKAPAQ